MLNFVMAMLISLLMIATVEASNCEFSYMNHGEDLMYICSGKAKIAKIENEKVFIEGKKAPSNVQDHYNRWRVEKVQNLNELREQKDKFNCSL